MVTKVVCSNVFILSTKPYRRWAYVLVKGCKVGGLVIVRGRWGGFRLFVKIKNWLVTGCWISTVTFLKSFMTNFKLKLAGVLFGWAVSFAMIGYYFRARKFPIPRRRLVLRKRRLLGFKNAVLPGGVGVFKIHCQRFRRKRLKTRMRYLRRQAMWLHFGFFYDIVILLPRNFLIHWRYRSFTLRSSNLVDLLAVVSYLRFTRNLFPYKVKGFAIESEASEKKRMRLKVGKKVRYR